MREDKQLHGIRLADVLEKRRLDQALNAKEFAVLAGISYSTAREWFHVPGFPVFRGVVFWQDFVRWRTAQKGFGNHVGQFSEAGKKTVASAGLPARAQRILNEA